MAPRIKKDKVEKNGGKARVLGLRNRVVKFKKEILESGAAEVKEESETSELSRHSRQVEIMSVAAQSKKQIQESGAAEVKEESETRELSLRSRQVEIKSVEARSKKQIQIPGAVEVKEESKTRELSLRSRQVEIKPVVKVEKMSSMKLENQPRAHKVKTKIIQSIKYEKHARVFAKVKGYQHWPALISESRAFNYKVKFFGTYDYRVVKPIDVLPLNSDNLLKFGSIKTKKYQEAYSQAMVEFLRHEC